MLFAADVIVASNTVAKNTPRKGDTDHRGRRGNATSGLRRAVSRIGSDRLAVGPANGLEISTKFVMMKKT